MTRDDLESVIWRHLPLPAGQAGEAVAVILAAADAYAAETLGEIDRYRRSEAASVHYDWHGYPACDSRSLLTGWLRTGIPARVTCGRCKRTTLWKNRVTSNSQCT